MYQIDNTTAATTQPASTPAGTAGFFTDGNPATNVPATIVPAEWLNAVMMELVNLVGAAGLTPSKAVFNQVLTAVRVLAKSPTVLADTGAANAYAATNSPALLVGTWTDYVVQRVRIANTNTGASTYAPDGLTAIPIYGLGLGALQGGELRAGGVATMMRITIPGVNSGSPICVLLDCFGGAQQITAGTSSQHAVQFGQVSGVVGQARSLKMSVTAASASATMTADEIVVESALGGLRYCVPNFNKTVNLATNGAGGMDTGAAPTNGYVALYAIYNPTSGASALLATNATSAAQPNVYGGANMPAGYTASALVSVWPTNAGSQFVVGVQKDRWFSRNEVAVLSTSATSASFISLSIASAVPLNAGSIRGNLSCGSSSASTTGIAVAADANGSGNQNINVGGTQVKGTFQVDLITPQIIYYTNSNSIGTPNYQVAVVSYSI